MSDHPTKDELSGFILGKLPPRAAEAVADHLELCPPCQETIVDLDAEQDTLALRLKQPPPASVEVAPHVKQVVAKVAAMMSQPADENPKPIEPSIQASIVVPPGQPGPTRDQFLAALRAANLFEPDELSATLQRPGVSTAVDGAALARALVESGALTKFQATLVYQNKPKGLVFGDYAVLDRLGAGGMGQVFKARHRRMKRVVALKVLSKAALNSPDAVKRFQREVEAAAKLIHPNIVTAFDAGRQDGIHYLVMEYVEGSDLSQLVKSNGPLPVDKAVDYIVQAARGLEFAHKKGIVHRDIKPANLLLDADGTVKILDMGLARVDDAMAGGAGVQDGLTQSGQVMGTVDYMAPEQAVDTRTADAKADVYALGCTLHRLLTGENVYGGETLVQKLLAHREQPIPSLTARRADVSAAVDAVFRHMLAKRPEERLQSMTQVIAELEAARRVPAASGPEADSRLTSFMQNFDPSSPRGGKLAAVTARSTQPAAELSPTLAQMQAEIATDPSTETGLSVEAKAALAAAGRGTTAAAKSSGDGRRRKPPTRWLAAAAGAAALIFFGVWIIVRDKDGNELARITAPDGSSVVMHNDSIAPPTSPPVQKSSGLPNLVGPQSTATDFADVYLDDLQESSWNGKSLNKHGVLHHEASTNSTIFIEWPGKSSKHSLATTPQPNSTSRLTYRLDGRYTRFRVFAGQARSMPETPLKLRVLGDAQLLWESPEITKRNEGFEVEVAVAGIRELHLEVSCPGNNSYAYAVWLEPRLTPIADSSKTPPPLAVAPFDAPQARGHQEVWAKYLGTTVETVNSVGAKMILIPPGEFLMGSTDEQVEAAIKAAEESKAGETAIYRTQQYERPQHRVFITMPYRLGATEVTVGQFRKFTAASHYVTEAEKYGFGDGGHAAIEGLNQATEQTKGLNWKSPRYVVSDDLPVTQVTWNDAVAYCQWLSTQENAAYRLPTEAEWEYACRSGTTTHYSFGDNYAELDKFGWCGPKGGNQPYRVGTKRSNPFRLFDMHGNAQEWCQDYFDEKWYAKSSSNDPTGPETRNAYADRVIRGGNWMSNASYSRSAYRSFASQLNRIYFTGFRVVREIDVPTVDLKSEISNPQSPTSAAATTVTLPPAPVGVPPSGGSGPAKAGTPAPPPAVAPFDATQAKQHQVAWAKYLGTTVETTNSVGMKMIIIPPGEFLMGSTPDQIEQAKQWAADTQALSDLMPFENELPARRVKLTKPLLMADTETTFGQFSKFIDATNYLTSTERIKPKVGADQRDAPTWRTYFDEVKAMENGTHYPVQATSTADALEFCNWLSAQEGLKPCYDLDATGNWSFSLNNGYRLPTEAEWEFACRAGTVTQFFCGDDATELPRYAVFDSQQRQAGFKCQAVASKLPNPFGLYDMLGNLSERCGDEYAVDRYKTNVVTDPSFFLRKASPAVVLRGGSYALQFVFSRSAYRASTGAVNYSPGIYGFRVVRVLELPTTASVAADPDRRAAEWVISVGGEVKVIQQGQTISVREPAALAQLGMFQVNQIHLRDAAKYSGTGLEWVQGLQGLSYLFADGTKFSNAELPVIVRTPNLWFVSIGKTAVTDDGLATIPPDTRIRSLMLDETQITDRGLEHLAKVPVLKTLSIRGTKATPAGVAKLRAALPACKVEWDDTKPAPSDNPTKTTDPAFQQWLKDVQAMPADDQAAAVVKKLIELNPGYDGIKLHKVVGDAVQLWEFRPDARIADITPIAALRRLQYVNCAGNPPSVGRPKIRNIEALRGLPLIYLNLAYSQISDLAALQGMSLHSLYLQGANVTDLSSLRGMSVLKTLNCSGTQVSDLSPLETCSQLVSLDVSQTKVTAAGIAALQKALPSCKIVWDAPPKPDAAWSNQPWNTPEFGQWTKEVQSLSAEEQVKAVSQKLQELNPGFDGDVGHSLKDGVVTQIVCFTDKVTDLSPLRVFSQLRSLNCGGRAAGRSKWSDLSVLEGLPIDTLHCSHTQVADLSMLSAMPLTRLICDGTRVVDLSPLKQLKLTELRCGNTEIADLAPLQNCPTLKNLNVTKTKVGVAEVSALQKALPNCKIEWDDPAKAMTPQPAPSVPK